VLRNSGFQQLVSTDSLITFERNDLERRAIAHSLRLESEFFSDEEGKQQDKQEKLKFSCSLRSRLPKLPLSAISAPPGVLQALKSSRSC
jgi:hypothetical protein